MENIDWKTILKTEKTAVRLAESEMDEDHEFTFVSLFQTDSGALGANVKCNTLPGDVLWLSGDFGPSNGLNSLIKAAGGNPDSIEGRTFLYCRVKSDKSPSGYAHFWRV